MPNKKRNPFEDHIESEAFDLSGFASDNNRLASDNSRLASDEDPRITCDMLHPLLTAFLETLPETDDDDLWEDRLDDLQRQLRACLTTEIIDKIAESPYRQRVKDLSEEDLAVLVMWPMTLALLAQDHLRHHGHLTPTDKTSLLHAEPARPRPATPPDDELRALATSDVNNPEWAQAIQRAYEWLRERWQAWRARFRRGGYR